MVGGDRYDALELYDDTISNFDAFEQLPNAKGFLVLREDNKKPVPAAMPEHTQLVREMIQSE